MKKNIIIIGILLLLSSCYSNPEDLEKIKELENNKIILEEELVKIREEKENDLFQKNITCGGLTDEIKKELFDPQYIYDTQDPQIEEIFFSNKLNSCLYVFSYNKDYCENIDFLSKEYNEFDCYKKNKILVDFSTKKYLAEDTAYNDGIIQTCLEKNEITECEERHGFKNKIKSYKN